MASEPVVSVVIPVFNGEGFVDKAIASVLAQTLADVEVIVIDDGSTDATASVVQRFEDPRLRYVYQENRGPSAARNRGIQLSSAPWIALLDCDDFWLPQKLEAQLARLRQSPSARMAYCAAIYCDIEGKQLAEIPAAVEGQLFEAMLMENCISGSASSALIDRTLLDQVGAFDEQLSWGEDWDLWLRISRVSEIAKVDAPLVHIVTRPGSLAKHADRMRDASLKLLDDAFTRYSVRNSRIRRRARWRVYMAAAITHHEHRNFGMARRDLLKAMFYRPTYVPAYWRFARTLMRRR